MCNLSTLFLSHIILGFCQYLYLKRNFRTVCLVVGPKPRALADTLRTAH